MERSESNKFYTTCMQTLKHRVNPEFIGIATKYYQHKQDRKLKQEVKKKFQSSRFYSQNLNKQLQRLIYSKSVELSRLESSRIRKLDQIKQKQELRQQRKAEIQKLKQQNYERKMNLKKKLQQSRQKMFNENQAGWRQLKRTLTEQTQFLEDSLRAKHALKARKASNIRESEAITLQNVNIFHRNKNKQSLQEYISRIKFQSKMKRQHIKKTNSLKKQLDKLGKSVSLKKNYLDCLNDQIHKFKTDIKSYNRRKLVSKKKQQDKQLKQLGQNTFETLYKHSEKSY